MTARFSCILLTFLVFLSNLHRTTANNDDDLYILIDEVSVFSCRGVRNEIRITEDDIDIIDESGEKVYFIHAPGNYTLSFSRINVKENFGHLAGEISLTLQVPIIEGPAGIRFDVPYQMIPETTLLSARCDAHSGIVERNGKQYCRYCALCSVSGAVESELNAGGHQFLPAVRVGAEKPFAPACDSITRNSYQFKRTISLPSRAVLEDMIKEKISGVDGEVKKRLNKGRGRFHASLTLISAEKPSLTQQQWFAASPDCKCCLNPSDASCLSSLPFFYCSLEECKSAWAQKCLHKTARIAACYTVQFNYRMTTSRAEVQQFLEEKQQLAAEQLRLRQRFPTASHQSFRQFVRPSATVPQRPALPPSPPPTAPPPPAQSAFIVESPSEPERNDEDVAPSTSLKPLSERCVEKIPSWKRNIIRFCSIFWNPNVCCSHCEGVC